MVKITYKDIALLIDKSEASIKGYKQSQPELLKVLILGAICKLNNINDEELELFINLKKQIESNILKED